MGSSRVTATQTVAANLKVDASGVAVPVTDNGGSLTVDGTVTATGPLTDTQLRATAVPVSAATLPLPTGAATAALQAGGLPAALGAGGGLKVDGSGTALPVSSATLATAAKQPALGIAGTASADVITVQGVASGVPLFGGLRQINISQTPTVSTSPAYTAGDALGGLLTFANAARTSAGSGLLQAVTVMCKTAALVPALELVLFNQTFTAVADNAAFNPSDGDMANCIGVIPISAWADYSLNSIATRFGLVFAFTLTGTSLFGQLVTRTAFTAAGTTDFIIGVQVIYAD